jgi:hypothetical protein
MNLCRHRENIGIYLLWNVGYVHWTLANVKGLRIRGIHCNPRQHYRSALDLILIPLSRVRPYYKKPSNSKFHRRKKRIQRGRNLKYTPDLGSSEEGTTHMEVGRRKENVPLTVNGRCSFCRGIAFKQHASKVMWKKDSESFSLGDWVPLSNGL